MSERPRFGIVGARGIGRHHATWLARRGCEVSALFATRRESAERAAAALRERFDFRGRVFWEWDAFLREGEFEAACVCSPPEAHGENALDLLRAGKHVLCEKPLVWDWDRSPERLLAEAEELAAAAQAAGRVLALNAQYPAALPALETCRRRLRGADLPWRRLEVLLETKTGPRSHHGGAEVWVDLGPHPLALLDALAGGGDLCLETLAGEGEGLQAEVTGAWHGPRGEIPFRFRLRRVPGEQPRRVFSDGELEIEYHGRRQPDGGFTTLLRSGGREWESADFLEISIVRFVAAVQENDPEQALVGPDAALRQTEALLRVWERCFAA